MPEFFGRPRESRLGEILAAMEQNKYGAISRGIETAGGALGQALGQRGTQQRHQAQQQQNLIATLAEKGLLGQGGATGTMVPRPIPMTGSERVWDQGIPLREAFPSAGFAPDSGMFVKTEESMSPLEVLKTGRFQPKGDIPAGERITAQNFSKYFELVPQTFVNEQGRIVTTAPHGAKALGTGEEYKRRGLEIREEELGLKKTAAQEKTAAAEEAKRAAKESVLIHIKNVEVAADKALESLGFTTTGITGAVLGMVPGTKRKALEGYISTLKSNLSFDRLQEMRDQSKTGGALGQVSNIELQLLSSTVAALDPDQPVEVLRENINSIKNQYQNILRKMQLPTDAGGSGLAPEKRKQRIAELRAQMAKKG